jgi:predicted metalloprotease
MKWVGRRQSTNVEDRRSLGSGKKMALGGGIMGIIIFVLVYFLGGGDSSQLLDVLQQQMGQSGQSNVAATDTAEDEMAQYIAVALADNEDVWNKIFSDNSLTYEEPKLVLFTDAIQSACGYAGAACGPFYCPGDKKVYIDLGFFNELQTTYGASGGDFAISYVLAHEIGHHVQNLLGVAGKVREQQSQVSEKEANRLSVALELQADFYSGIWAHYTQKTKNVLEEGDIEEALSAASAVGDDRIQKKSQGYVVPDAFTHGTSEQRMYWFKKGFSTGDISQGNTFKYVK